MMAEIIVKNRCLETGIISGYVLSEKAKCELLEKLPGTPVFLGYLNKPGYQDAIGAVKSVEGKSLVIELDNELGTQNELLSRLDFTGKTIVEDKIKIVQSVSCIHAINMVDDGER
jgi:hypothetical protein